MKENLTGKTRRKDFGIAFLVCFLFAFMLMIFGPAEIFFVNVAEFKFVYGEFVWILAAAAVICSAAVSLITAFLPPTARKIILSVIFGLSVAGYAQVMFINEGLDLLGMNPEGYRINGGQAAANVILWLLIIVLAAGLSIWKEKIWQNVICFGAVFLIGIQSAAWISLMLSAEETAYKYEEGEWYLSGENQFMVSADKNIIVLVLDYFSNQYIDPAMEKYPDLLDCMNDFTYYGNTDCTYFGTYPSLAHILSGSAPDPSLTVNDWTSKIWQDEKAVGFYKALRDQNFVSNIYTPDKNMLCGMNSAEILQGVFSNVTNAGQDFNVDYPLLTKTMLKMSGYRMFPYALKPYLYTNVGEYSEIMTPKSRGVSHENHRYYGHLLEEGLKTDKESNYYIFQHLSGTHSYDTTADGQYTEKSSMEETAKGCMVIVEEYLSQLKELGVYDDATIIVTSDHGGPRDSQVIFFMKNAHETHDEMAVNDAPISLAEFQATIAQAAGIDYAPYGPAVSDISPTEPRERTVWVRLYVDTLPSVPKYSGEGESVSNAYCGFTYTGDIDDLMEKYDAGPDEVIPETDGFF